MTEQKRPEISIIVPVYKVEKYLNECIDSILAQTFTDFELILVDDGSPDNCPALCDAAAAKDSRIRVIHQQNKGLSGARNAGIEIARGNWIAFVDSDDAITPDYCEKLYHAVQETGAKMAVCNYWNVDEQLQPAGEQYLHVKHEIMTTEQALEHCTLVPYIVVWNKLYHKSIFDELRFALGKINEDTIFVGPAYEKAEKIANISDVLYLYRKVPGSIMNSKITLRNLDGVEGMYTIFECARKHGVTGSLYELYWLLRRNLQYVSSNLTAEECRSSRMKEAKKYKHRAWLTLWKEHAITFKTLGYMQCYYRSMDEYAAIRWKTTSMRRKK